MGRHGGSYDMDEKTGKAKTDRKGNVKRDVTLEIDAGERMQRKMKERAELADKMAQGQKLAAAGNKDEEVNNV